MVRGCFTRVTVLADGQELLEEIPAEDAVIPNLAERNLYLQLGRGTPPPGMHTQPSLAVVAVLAAHPGLRDELTAVPRYPHDSNTVDDVGQKLEPTASPGCLSAELGKRWLWLEPGSSLAHTSTSAALGCPWMAGQPGLSGVVVTKAWRQMGVNPGSLLRHAVDTSRQLEAAHVSWQADWADWQALGGQPNSRPYRPPSPFAITPGCSCKAHHIKLDTRAIYGLVRAAGMLPADITSLPKWLRPVRSMATRSCIRGLMCSTSINSIRFYDRDVSAALNIRRIAAGPGRPRELSSWLGRPAIPNPGRPGQEWVCVRDKGLLRKWQRRHQRQRHVYHAMSQIKQTIRLPLTKEMCVR
ncbi:hypothetical protein QJQ45_013510 [Haematococcus lacustris]|nr:hypothetical protein QJQ45_013510 [Haematococcus lacustris]